MCVCVRVCHTCSGGSVYVLPSPTDTQMTSRWISYTCRARDISGRSVIRAAQPSSDRSREFLPAVGGFPVDPPRARDRGSRGGTAAGPVYSAVGLPRSRGKRGCAQGLINHGCFGRDKQAGPSRDAAAPAADRGGVGQRRVEVVEVGVGGRPGGVWTGGGRGEETVDSHTRGYTITLALWFHICMAAQACKSTFLVWPDANRAPGASA